MPSRAFKSITRGLATAGAAAAVLVFLPHALSAQAGSTTDILVGRVTAEDGSPIERVQILATSIETGLARTVLSRATGQYTVVFPDGGGRYQVVVRRLGYQPVRLTLERRADTDRIVADVVLHPVALVLDTIAVTIDSRDVAVAPSGTGRAVSQDEINRLPVEPGDLNAIAALAPGVVGAGATDTSATAFSVAGQAASQNAITLDGVSQGSGVVPRDAVRSTTVTTNTYDIAKGQFSGGQISSTTRSGTNRLAGSATVTWRDPKLSATGSLSPAFSDGNRIAQMSAGFGGPLVRNRLFAFGSMQVNYRTGPVPSLLSADPTTLNRLGVSPDSLSRFVAAVTAMGIGAAPTNFPKSRDTDDESALVRVDYHASEAHQFVLRGDWHASKQSGARTEGTSFAGSGGYGDGRGGGGMVTLTSHSGSIVNDVRMYGATDRQTAQPYWFLPRGRVSVSSTLASGTNGVTSLSFGGANSLPRNSRSTLFEAGDELSWLSPTAAHRIKFGVLFNRTELTSDQTRNQYGTMIYASLADLEANIPASFSRVILSSPRQTTGSASAAAYVGDVWRPTDALELSIGTRVENSHYLHPPAYNAQVEALFNRRTDHLPSEVHLSPRVGFTYAPGGKSRPPLTLRGGVGEFRGNALGSLFAQAITATGLPSGQLQLNCIGGGVPAPDWGAYARDPSTIPSTCAGVSAISAVTPGVLVFEPGFTSPRTWRASLGVTKRFGKIYSLVADLLYARGVSQLGMGDLNLDTMPKFTLANEGGRPVYVPLSTVDPATGTTSSTASRRVTTLGLVSEARSSLHSDTEQLILTLSRSPSKGVGLDLSYTITRARAFSLGFPGGEAEGTTSGNPNRAELGENGDARPHNIQLTASIPLGSAADIRIVGNAVSGRPFTAEVWGDINGDGQFNDRAFIFDPAKTTDPLVASGMQQLLATTTGLTRACLERSLGRIATTNDCMTPWETGLEVQLNLTPKGLGLRRRMTLSLTAQNGMAGLDDIVHGISQVRGWGQSARNDDRLLYVQGFDPATGTFHYRVNQHFGASSLAQTPYRSPFRLQIKARYALGS